MIIYIQNHVVLKIEFLLFSFFIREASQHVTMIYTLHFVACRSMMSQFLMSVTTDSINGTCHSLNEGSHFEFSLL